MSGKTPDTSRTTPGIGSEEIRTAMHKEYRQCIDDLRNPDKQTRARAAHALGEAGDQAVDLLAPLLKDPEWKVRYRVAEALGFSGSERAVSCLTGALTDPKDHVRYMAAKAIGLIGSGVAEGDLVARLGDENEFVRRSAAIALGKTGTPAAVTALKQSVIHETSESTREGMLDAVEMLQKKYPGRIFIV